MSNYNSDREETINFELISKIFNGKKGYFDLPNSDLGQLLISWNLEENGEDETIISNYIKWSFTASFLQLINAWQWFFSGIILGRQGNFPAQTMQMNYYSIFFSYGAFLSAQLKGHYTLKIDPAKKTKTRKEVWIVQNIDSKVGEETFCIKIKQKGKRGEHEIRSNWFYEVFKDWDFKNDYQDVLSFYEDRKFHSRFRNKYTYSLSDIAEELYEIPNSISPSNEILIRLWNRDYDWTEYYPEQFWALEHIKIVVDLHIKLLKQYHQCKQEIPYKYHQIRLINSLCKHHSYTGLTEIIKETMSPILNVIKDEN